MSLKTELKKRILDDVIKRSRSGDEYVVLVVDSHTSQILSSCCRVYDVMEAGVLVLENLGKVREKLDMAAVYFIEPSEASVRRLILDFVDKKAPQYTEVYLYFTSRVPDELMQDISACPQLVDRVKDLKEMNCDFSAYESRVFLFNRRGTIIDLYHPDSNGEVRHKEIDTTAKQIVGVCITMGEYPHIRYNAANKICSDVAVRVEDGLNRLASAMPDWEMSRDRERGTLLILDRSVDPLAPLMHEYTYQAMICDLVKIKGEVAYIPKKASDEDAKELEESADSLYKEVLLAEDDPLWVEFRHQHIGQVLQTITKKFAEFKGKNAMAKMSSKGGEANVKDMINAMKAMPEYKAMIRQYFKHLSLAEECMKHFDDDYLEVLSELEQDMATGLDKNKREVKSKDVQNRITTMLQSDKVSLPNKLRALMIYVISQGSVGRSRKDLLDAAGINSTLERVIINLKYLGIDLQKKVQPVNRNQERLALAANAMNRISMNLMRFVPLLSEIASQLVQDTLSRDTYPYLKDPPIKSRAAKEDVSSSRKKRTGWRVAREPAESKEDDKAAASTSRYLIVMLGGVTYSEMRCVYEIVQDTKAQLYIGSTEALTGEHFIRALGGFEDDADLNTVGRNTRAAAAAGPSGSKPSAAGAGSSAAAKGGNKKAAYADDDDDEYDSLDDDDDAPPRRGKPTPAPKGSSRR